MLGIGQARDPNLLFSVTRVFENAPRGYETSQSGRAILIRQMI